MKKILISVLIVLLLVLAYIMLFKGLEIGFVKVDSLKQIEEKSNKLDENLNNANELSNKTYPTEIDSLEDAIRKLKISKEEYQKKKINDAEGEEIGTVEVKTYTIHYLWTILGNYREKTGINTLTLDLKTTENKDIYDLGFTLTGNYVSITDFLYEIEENEQLKFQIKDFKIASSIEKQTEPTEQENKNSILPNGELKKEEVDKKDSTATEEKSNEEDGIILQSTFTVENIGITLE